MREYRFGHTSVVVSTSAGGRTRTALARSPPLAVPRHDSAFLPLDLSRILPPVRILNRLESGGVEPQRIEGSLVAAGLRFAIVASRWNDFIVGRLVDGAVDGIVRHGGSVENVSVYRVPGSFEIPLVAKRLAGSGKWDAIICLGAVIRGETPHFDHVAGEAFKGIAHASLATDVPIVAGIVTADTLDQAINRAGAKSGNKGYEAAVSAIEMANLLRSME